jgi:hypothetical protein
MKIDSAQETIDRINKIYMIHGQQAVVGTTYDFLCKIINLHVFRIARILVNDLVSVKPTRDAVESV